MNNNNYYYNFESGCDVNANYFGFSAPFDDRGNYPWGPRPLFEERSNFWRFQGPGPVDYTFFDGREQFPTPLIRDTVAQLRSEVQVPLERLGPPQQPGSPMFRSRKPWQEPYGRQQGRHRRRRSHLDDIYYPNYDVDEENVGNNNFEPEAGGNHYNRLPNPQRWRPYPASDQVRNNRPYNDHIRSGPSSSYGSRQQRTSTPQRQNIQIKIDGNKLSNPSSGSATVTKEIEQKEVKNKAGSSKVLEEDGKVKSSKDKASESSEKSKTISEHEKVKKSDEKSHKAIVESTVSEQKSDPEKKVSVVTDNTQEKSSIPVHDKTKTSKEKSLNAFDKNRIVCLEKNSKPSASTGQSNSKENSKKYEGDKQEKGVVHTSKTNLNSVTGKTCQGKSKDDEFFKKQKQNGKAAEKMAACDNGKPEISQNNNGKQDVQVVQSKNASDESRIESLEMENTPLTYTEQNHSKENAKKSEGDIQKKEVSGTKNLNPMTENTSQDKSKDETLTKEKENDINTQKTSVCNNSIPEVFQISNDKQHVQVVRSISLSGESRIACPEKKNEAASTERDNSKENDKNSKEDSQKHDVSDDKSTKTFNSITGKELNNLKENGSTNENHIESQTSDKNGSNLVPSVNTTQEKNSQGSHKRTISDHLEDSKVGRISKEIQNSKTKIAPSSDAFTTKNDNSVRDEPERPSTPKRIKLEDEGPVLPLTPEGVRKNIVINLKRLAIPKDLLPSSSETTDDDDISDCEIVSVSTLETPHKTDSEADKNHVSDSAIRTDTLKDNCENDGGAQGGSSKTDIKDCDVYIEDVFVLEDEIAKLDRDLLRDSSVTRLSDKDDRNIQTRTPKTMLSNTPSNLSPTENKVVDKSDKCSSEQNKLDSKFAPISSASGSPKKSTPSNVQAEIILAKVSESQFSPISSASSGLNSPQSQDQAPNKAATANAVKGASESETDSKTSSPSKSIIEKSSAKNFESQLSSTSSTSSTSKPSTSQSDSHKLAATYASKGAAQTIQTDSKTSSLSKSITNKSNAKNFETQLSSISSAASTSKPSTSQSDSHKPATTNASKVAAQIIQTDSKTSSPSKSITDRSNAKNFETQLSSISSAASTSKPSTLQSDSHKPATTNASKVAAQIIQTDSKTSSPSKSITDRSNAKNFETQLSSISSAASTSKPSTSQSDSHKPATTNASKGAAQTIQTDSKTSSPSKSITDKSNAKNFETQLSSISSAASTSKPSTSQSDSHKPATTNASKGAAQTIQTDSKTSSPSKRITDRSNAKNFETQLSSISSASSTSKPSTSQSDSHKPATTNASKGAAQTIQTDSKTSSPSKRIINKSSANTFESQLSSISSASSTSKPSTSQSDSHKPAATNASKGAAQTIQTDSKTSSPSKSVTDRSNAKIFETQLSSVSSASSTSKSSTSQSDSHNKAAPTTNESTATDPKTASPLKGVVDKSIAKVSESQSSPISAASNSSKSSISQSDSHNKPANDATDIVDMISSRSDSPFSRTSNPDSFASDDFLILKNIDTRSSFMDNHLLMFPDNLDVVDMDVGSPGSSTCRGANKTPSESTKEKTEDEMTRDVLDAIEIICAEITSSKDTNKDEQTPKEGSNTKSTKGNCSPEDDEDVICLDDLKSGFLQSNSALNKNMTNAESNTQSTRGKKQQIPFFEDSESNENTARQLPWAVNTEHIDKSRNNQTTSIASDNETIDLTEPETPPSVANKPQILQNNDCSSNNKETIKMKEQLPSVANKPDITENVEDKKNEQSNSSCSPKNKESIKISNKQQLPLSVASIPDIENVDTNRNQHPTSCSSKNKETSIQQEPPLSVANKTKETIKISLNQQLLSSVASKLGITEKIDEDKEEQPISSFSSNNKETVISTKQKEPLSVTNKPENPDNVDMEVKEQPISSCSSNNKETVISTTQKEPLSVTNKPENPDNVDMEVKEQPRVPSNSKNAKSIGENIQQEAPVSSTHISKIRENTDRHKKRTKEKTSGKDVDHRRSKSSKSDRHRHHKQKTKTVDHGDTTVQSKKLETQQGVKESEKSLESETNLEDLGYHEVISRINPDQLLSICGEMLKEDKQKSSTADLGSKSFESSNSVQTLRRTSLSDRDIDFSSFAPASSSDYKDDLLLLMSEPREESKFLKMCEATQEEESLKENNKRKQSNGVSEDEESGGKCAADDNEINFKRKKIPKLDSSDESEPEIDVTNNKRKKRMVISSSDEDSSSASNVKHKKSRNVSECSTSGAESNNKRSSAERPRHSKGSKRSVEGQKDSTSRHSKGSKKSVDCSGQIDSSNSSSGKESEKRFKEAKTTPRKPEFLTKADYEEKRNQQKISIPPILDIEVGTMTPKKIESRRSTFDIKADNEKILQKITNYDKLSFIFGDEFVEADWKETQQIAKNDKEKSVVRAKNDNKSKSKKSDKTSSKHSVKKAVSDLHSQKRKERDQRDANKTQSKESKCKRDHHQSLKSQESCSKSTDVNKVVSTERRNSASEISSNKPCSKFMDVNKVVSTEIRNSASEISTNKPCTKSFDVKKVVSTERRNSASEISSNKPCSKSMDVNKVVSTEIRNSASEVSSKKPEMTATNKPLSIKRPTETILEPSDMYQCCVFYNDIPQSERIRGTSIVENDCTDNAFILEEVTICNDSVVIKIRPINETSKDDSAESSRDDDVIEIVPQVPLIDLTDEGESSRKESNEVHIDLTEDDEPKIEPELVETKSESVDNTITLYRSDETADGAEEVQAMQASMNANQFLIDSKKSDDTKPADNKLDDKKFGDKMIDDKKLDDTIPNMCDDFHKKVEGAKDTLRSDKDSGVESESSSSTTQTNNREPYSSPVPQIISELNAMGLSFPQRAMPELNTACSSDPSCTLPESSTAAPSVSQSTIPELNTANSNSSGGSDVFSPAAASNTGGNAAAVPTSRGPSLPVLLNASDHQRTIGVDVPPASVSQNHSSLVASETLDFHITVMNTASNVSGLDKSQQCQNQTQSTNQKVTRRRTSAGLNTSTQMQTNQTSRGIRKKLTTRRASTGINTTEQPSQTINQKIAPRITQPMQPEEAYQRVGQPITTCRTNTVVEATQQPFQAAPRQNMQANADIASNSQNLLHQTQQSVVSNNVPSQNFPVHDVNDMTQLRQALSTNVPSQNVMRQHANQNLAQNNQQNIAQVAFQNISRIPLTENQMTAVTKIFAEFIPMYVALKKALSTFKSVPTNNVLCSRINMETDFIMNRIKLHAAELAVALLHLNVHTNDNVVSNAHRLLEHVQTCMSKEMNLNMPLLYVCISMIDIMHPFLAEYQKNIFFGTLYNVLENIKQRLFDKIKANTVSSAPNATTSSQSLNPTLNAQTPMTSLQAPMTSSRAPITGSQTMNPMTGSQSFNPTLNAHTPMTSLQAPMTSLRAPITGSQTLNPMTGSQAPRTGSQTLNPLNGSQTSTTVLQASMTNLQPLNPMNSSQAAKTSAPVPAASSQVPIAGSKAPMTSSQQNEFASQVREYNAICARTLEQRSQAQNAASNPCPNPLRNIVNSLPTANTARPPNMSPLKLCRSSRHTKSNSALASGSSMNIPGNSATQHANMNVSSNNNLNTLAPCSSLQQHLSNNLARYTVDHKASINQHSYGKQQDQRTAVSSRVNVQPQMYDAGACKFYTQQNVQPNSNLLNAVPQASLPIPPPYTARQQDVLNARNTLNSFQQNKVGVPQNNRTSIPQPYTYTQPAAPPNCMTQQINRTVQPQSYINAYHPNQMSNSSSHTATQMGTINSSHLNVTAQPPSFCGYSMQQNPAMPQSMPLGSQVYPGIAHGTNSQVIATPGFRNMSSTGPLITSPSVLNLNNMCERPGSFAVPNMTPVRQSVNPSKVHNCSSLPTPTNVNRPYRDTPRYEYENVVRPNLTPYNADNSQRFPQAETCPQDKNRSQNLLNELLSSASSASEVAHTRNVSNSLRFKVPIAKSTATEALNDRGTPVFRVPIPLSRPNNSSSPSNTLPVTTTVGTERQSSPVSFGGVAVPRTSPTVSNQPVTAVTVCNTTPVTAVAVQASQNQTASLSQADTTLTSTTVDSQILPSDLSTVDVQMLQQLLNASVDSEESSADQTSKDEQKEVANASTSQSSLTATSQNEVVVINQDSDGPMSSPAQCTPEVKYNVEEREIETIDLTWMDDLDVEELEQSLNFVFVKKEEQREEPENVAPNENIVVPSPADSGISSPTYQNEQPEVVVIEKVCICGVDATYICVCNNAWYCSEECQLRDWESHLTTCQRLRTDNSRNHEEDKGS